MLMSFLSVHVHIYTCVDSDKISTQFVKESIDIQIPIERKLVEERMQYTEELI